MDHRCGAVHRHVLRHRLNRKVNVTLHHGDCLEFLKTLPAGRVDAVVTDPPYGLGQRMKSGGSGEWSKGWTEAPEWDSTVANGIAEIVGAGRQAIIWGGNYYPLAPMRGWLVWDKMQVHTSGHAELAWTTLDQPVRTFRLSRVEAYSRMNKQHPTQKPIKLMEWCLSFLPEGCTVLDPFMGSGTTGVACVNTGRNFIGCEIDKGYFDIASKRIAAAQQAKSELLIA
jgi:site-specific DNA-methyltransferase (adenine-specific)